MKKHILHILSWLLSLHGFSQEQVAGGYKPQIIPPSSESAALAQYAAIPVSYYTGTPQINIPLYNVKSGSLNLPIGLSYHASGIKVEQKATRTGLGWTLNAGGAITRSVYGMADDVEYKGFIDVVNDPIYNINFFQHGNDNDRKEEIIALSANCLDAQPDIFYFNFNGMTGKFTFNWNGEIVADSKSKLNITYLRDESTKKIISWVIIDDSGNTYKFEAIEVNEISQVTGYSVCTSVYNQYNSGWYLTEIHDVNNTHAIFLNYEDNDEYVESQLSTSILHNGNTEDANCPVFSKTSKPGTRKGEESSSITNFIYHGVYVSEIWIKNGYYSDTIVGFITEYYEEPNFGANKALKKIIINNDTTQQNIGIIKNYDLGYDYSTGRLTLRSIVEHNKGDSLPPFKFNYCLGQLPKNNRSNAQDHWGFYNGKTFNKTLAGEFKALEDSEVITYLGGDRSPEAAFMKYGSLKSIIFPTGGTQEFFFEPHSYGFVGSEELPPVYPQVLAQPFELKTTEVSNSQSLSEIVEIPNNIPGNTKFSAELFCSIGYDPFPGIVKPWASISKCLDAACNQTEPLCVMNGGVEVLNEGRHIIRKYELAPGKYKLQVFKEDDFNTNSHYALARLSYTYNDLENPNYDKLAGGLRIASIVEKDNENSSEIKRMRRFEYIWDQNSGRSSGVIYNEPQYFYGVINFVQDIGQATSDICNYSIQTGKSTALLSTTQGSHIGYRKVEEWNGPDSQLGKTVYHYTSPFEFGDIISGNGSISPPPTSYSYKTGKLTQRDDFANAYTTETLLQRELFTYGEYESEVQGLKVWSPYNIGQGTSASNIPDYGLGLYKVILGRSQPIKKELINYSEDGIDSIKTVTYYSYDSPLQYLKTKHVKYNGNREVKTEYYYPHDFTNPSIAIQRMVDSNWVSPSIETVVKTKNNAADGLRVTGATFLKPTYSGGQYSRLYFPQTVSTLKLEAPVNNFDYAWDNNGNVQDARYDVDMTVDMRDYRNGLPWQITNKAGIVESYCYNNFEELIVKATNATKYEFFYTGFEDEPCIDCPTAPLTSDSASTAVGKTDEESFSGRYSWQNNGGNTSFTIYICSSGKYIVSFWAKGTSLKVQNVGGLDTTILLANNKWTRHAFEIESLYSTLVYINNLNGFIDEVRSHPKDAQMLTVANDYLVGPISIMEENGKPTHYEYDNLNRLRLVRDHNKDIIERITYKYGLFNIKPIEYNFELDTLYLGGYKYKFTVNPASPDTFKYKWDFDDGTTATRIDQNFISHQYDPISIDRTVKVKVISKTTAKVLDELVMVVPINGDNLCQEIGGIVTTTLPNGNGLKLSVNDIAGLEYDWRFKGVKPDCEEFPGSGASTNYTFPGGVGCNFQVSVTLNVKINNDKVCHLKTVIYKPSPN